MRRESRKQNIIIGIIVLLLVLTIGYATLQTNLTINGTSKINNSTWNIHFNNPTPTPGSVAIDTSAYQDAKAATKDSATQVSFNILLSEPGDFYEFTVPVENEGSIDTMIDEITSTIQIGNGTVQNITSQTLPAWLNYSVTYSDGMPIVVKQKLDHGTTETYKVRVEFKKDITNAQLQDAANKELHFVFGVKYVQKDDTAVNVPHPTSFADDSWETISAVAKANNTAVYPVGSTKSVTINIDLDKDGSPEEHTYTLRVANTSVPAECSIDGFSQSACGFVLEFEDIIMDHRMNPYTNSGANGDSNNGGWEYSEMRTYVNNDIYNALPADLKKAIISTKVVSGYGNNDSSNFITTDYLYLISANELWGNSVPNDTAKSVTRQLDYYKLQNVDVSSSLGAVKQYNNSNHIWTLRSAVSYSSYSFFSVDVSGVWYPTYADSSYGVSPAFRLG